MGSRGTRLTWVGLAGLAAVLLAGCARPFISPILPPPHREVISAPYDTTWSALIRALATENVPLRAVAKDSGVVASHDLVSPIGVYADCGRLGAALLEGEALISFTVFVQPNGTLTEVQVNSKMRTQAYRRGSSGKLKADRIFECASTGRWESNLLDTVRRLVRE
jgi:hypothetical protein